MSLVSGSNQTTFFKYLMASMPLDIFIRRKIVNLDKALINKIKTLAREYSDQQIWNNKPLMRVINKLSDE